MTTPTLDEVKSLNDKWTDEHNFSDCSDCSNCSNCLYCRDFYNHRSGYYICNIEVSCEEFEAKKKELGVGE